MHDWLVLCSCLFMYYSSHGLHTTSEEMLLYMCSWMVATAMPCEELRGKGNSVIVFEYVPSNLSNPRMVVFIVSFSHAHS
jgi:hypothetical protein